jgi:hypothetical protein
MSMFASHYEKEARATQGPSEGTVAVFAIPAALTVIDLASVFPNHWDSAYFSITVETGSMLCSLSTSASPSAPTGVFRSVLVERFLTRGRRYLALQSPSGTVTVRIWPDDVTLNNPIDYLGTLPIMGAAPLALVHADQVQGDIGSTPTGYPVFGGVVNANQDIPPTLANGWSVGNRRTLDFTANTALRVDKLASAANAIAGPMVTVIACIVPNTAAQRTLVDWQDTAQPATRFWDEYLTAGNQLGLYLQGNAAAVGANSGVIPGTRFGVPVIYAVVKRTTGTWSVAVRGGDTNPASLLVASAANAGAGAANFKVVTIGAEYNGTVYQNFLAGHVRAFGCWQVDATDAQLLSIVDHFATSPEILCPTF